MPELACEAGNTECCDGCSSSILLITFDLIEEAITNRDAILESLRREELRHEIVEDINRPFWNDVIIL